MILEYLRTVRDLSRAEMMSAGTKPAPLSVYDSYYFPLRFQFIEINKSNGKIKYIYNKISMPQWKDLSNYMKIELFQLMCEDLDESLYSFNPKIHPDLVAELKGKDLVAALARRMRRELVRLGDKPRHHVFVVEGHDRKGGATDLHIHGMAMVEGKGQAHDVLRASGRAAGQDVKGRGRLPSGNSGEFCYYVVGKSWARYMTKNVDRVHSAITRRSVVFSRRAIQLTKAFYERVTGQG